jgi:uncharacterized iron-regulated protein
MTSKTRVNIATAVAGFLGAGLFISLLSGFGAVAGDRESAMTPIVVNRAQSATLPELMSKLRDERLVYVGETHTAWGDHLLQLEVLREMAAQPGELAVGVEWIQARFQPALDGYFAGRIDESAFLRQTEYFDRWRFDYRLYRPIIEFARANNVRVVALNASRELTDAIKAVGVDGLTGELAAEAPDHYDFGNAEYEKQLRTMFAMHRNEGQDDDMFRRFLEVQLTWDEKMAERVAEYLAGGNDRRMLVLAGKGHISGRSGIPDRVTRRTGIEGVTIATFNPASRMFNTADYMVLANEESLPPAGLMRVFLDENEEGVFIRDFSPGSPAREAGVKKNDRIARINGRPIRYFVDVKLQLLDKRPGDEIEVETVRQSLIMGEEFNVARFKLAGEQTGHHAG